RRTVAPGGNALWRGCRSRPKRGSWWFLETLGNQGVSPHRGPHAVVNPSTRSEGEDDETERLPATHTMPQPPCPDRSGRSRLTFHGVYARVLSPVGEPGRLGGCL